MTEFEHLIYEQLLELYIYDLEMEVLVSKLQEVEPLNITYSEKYDAWYYPETNEWAEPKCHDPNCCYCVKRPERPL